MLAFTYITLHSCYAVQQGRHITALLSLCLLLRTVPTCHGWCWALLFIPVKRLNALQPVQGVMESCCLAGSKGLARPELAALHGCGEKLPWFWPIHVKVPGEGWSAAAVLKYLFQTSCSDTHMRGINQNCINYTVWQARKMFHKRYECWQGGDWETYERNMGLEYNITRQTSRDANIREEKWRGIKVPELALTLLNQYNLLEPHSSWRIYSAS